MGTHGLLFWLFINLGYDHQFLHRISKRSADTSGECQPRKRNSFLWVMKRNPPVYFFGTIHVPYTKVWDYIPLNSKRAFRDTDNIYFELDLTDMVTHRTLAQCQILPNGLMLRDVVPRTLYRRLKRHLHYIRKMLPVWMTFDQRMMGFTPLHLYKGLTKNWYKKRPIWIMLMVNALTEYDIKGRGISVLDTYLIREAVLRSKHTHSIETVEDQCKPLNALNDSQVITALNQTLILHEKIRRGEAKLTYSTKELIYHYNCGDLSKVLFKQDRQSLSSLDNSSQSSFDMEETRKIDQYLREELIYRRNKRMAQRAIQVIQKEPKKSFFFAFGVGHFLGNGSIIDILQKQGYNVSHVKPGRSLPRYGPKRKVKNTGRKRKRKRRRRRRRRRSRTGKIDNLWQRLTTPITVLTTKNNRLLADESLSSGSVRTPRSDLVGMPNRGSLSAISFSSSTFMITRILWVILLVIHAVINI